MNIRILQNNESPNYEINKGYPERESTDIACFSPCYDVPISDIEYRHEDNQVRMQTKDPNHLADVAASINSKGLRNPIILSIDNNGVIVVESGHHRFESYKFLEKKSIPAYFVTYKGEPDQIAIIREEFLQQENNHLPVKAMTLKDAEKYLFKMKKLGSFVGLSKDEEYTKCEQLLKKAYTHLSESKIGNVMKAYKKGVEPPSYRNYVAADRKEWGKKYEYTAKSTTYDFNHKCFYINANLDNSAKSVATIDKYTEIPTGVAKDDVSIHVFCNTGAKDKTSADQAKEQFITKMNVANKNFSRFQVKKVFFMPDLVSQIDCEIYEWVPSKDGKTGSFNKLQKDT